METKPLTLAGFVPNNQIGIVQSAQFRNVYTNAVRTGVLPWDIRLIFGEIVQRADQTQFVEEQVTVIMSPAQAKAVLRILTGSIKNYEKLFGEIKDITPIMEKAAAEAAATAGKPNT